MLLVFGSAGGAGAYAAHRVRAARAGARERREELARVRRVAEEDVTVLGEQLRRLGEHVAGRELTTAAREDYQVALDAYEHAKREVGRIDDLDEISGIVDTLATGRYAMVCVRAQVAGEPVPERSVPCFFNPQHGPSARKVMWTSPRTGTRTVPACSRCVAQLEARERPEVRTVQLGGRRVPYWEAGAALHPYSKGYFPDGEMSGAMAWMYQRHETALGAAGAFGGSFGAFDLYDGGAGGFDGGGADGGGGVT